MNMRTDRMRSIKKKPIGLAIALIVITGGLGCGLQAAARPEPAAASSAKGSSKGSAARSTAAAKPSQGSKTKGRSAPAKGTILRGKASYYADSLAGRSTASGEPYAPRKLTAAHLELPFGTRVRVTRIDNRKSVVVRINDRSPYGGRGRIIDLSRRAAEQLDMIRAGVVEVEVEILGD